MSNRGWHYDANSINNTNNTNNNNRNNTDFNHNNDNTWNPDHRTNAAEWSWPSDLGHSTPINTNSISPSSSLPHQTPLTSLLSLHRPTESITPAPAPAPASASVTPPTAAHTPHYHRQLPPLSHTNPIASLTAALRGEDPNPPISQTFQSSSTSHQPPSPRRPLVAANPQSSFAYHLDSLLSPSSSHHQAPSSTTAATPTTADNANISTATNFATGSSANAASSSAMPPRNTASTARKRSNAAITVDLDTSPKSKKQRKNSGMNQVDLSGLDDDDDQPTAEKQLLDKEREELIKRQREESNKPIRLNDITCMICLEQFTNMSVTHCGHLFCHECLDQALNASQRASERETATCPACRKTIKRGPTARSQIFPLTLMKRPRP